jgi:hypothetical protein
MTSRLRILLSRYVKLVVQLVVKLVVKLPIKLAVKLVEKRCLYYLYY